MLQEFKKFAMKGSVMDMAIGIIIGGAFTPIVKSLVDDIIMPPVGLVLGDVDFSNMFMVLREGSEAGPYGTLEMAREVGAVTLNYGAFVNTIFIFLIVAFSVFLMVKNINRWQQEEEAKPAPPAQEVVLLEEIRDAIRQGGGS